MLYLTHLGEKHKATSPPKKVASQLPVQFGSETLALLGMHRSWVQSMHHRIKKGNNNKKYPKSQNDVTDCDLGT